MKIPVHEGPRAEAWLDGREAGPGSEVLTRVGEIVEQVRSGGEEAVLELTGRLDGVRPSSFRVSADACRGALEGLPPRRRDALERAARNIGRFHAAQRRDEDPVEVEPGVTCWREFRPVERVGVYAPGGGGDYPSSLLMAAVPARVAGCREVVVCSPPGPGGHPSTAVMAAAAAAGVDGLYAAGGAQAVAAMALGTESLPPVDKVFGPGGRWVNAAKMELYGEVAVDLPAGPSEVAVWADAATDPGLVAAELLAQAEHGPDSLAVGILPDRGAAAGVVSALEGRLEAAPRREAAGESLARSALLVAPEAGRALRWIDRLAPEHLVLLGDGPESRLHEVRNAGSVFLGPWSPVAAGDYAAGTNHVLPTGRRARAAGGLSLDDFGKWIQVQRLDRDGLRRLAPAIVELAEWEGFPAHAASVRERIAEEAPDGGREGRGREAGAEAVGPLRPHVRDLVPYATARSRHGSGVLLDANENSLGTLAPELDEALHRYPDPGSGELRERLAERSGVAPDRLWLGNGSDEAIDLLVRALAGPGDPVVVAGPTYGVYADRVRAQDAAVREVRLDDRFDLDVEATARAASGSRLVFLCSPNNPTGGLLSRERVLELARRTRAVVAVDEAYVEFSGADSLAGNAGDRGRGLGRLAVLRTFSKAWGLAGARVGWLAGDPRLVSAMRRVGLPYPLSRPAAAAALAALEREEEMRRRVARIRRERRRLRRGLEALGLEVLPSEANFLLFFVEAPARVQRRLAREHGVVVRDRSGLTGLDGALRVTVGTVAEDDRLLRGLEETLDGGASGREAVREPRGGRP